eukprot:1500062-Rhodomonas_salina.2
MMTMLNTFCTHQARISQNRDQNMLSPPIGTRGSTFKKGSKTKRGILPAKTWGQTFSAPVLVLIARRSS